MVTSTMVVVVVEIQMSKRQNGRDPEVLKGKKIVHMGFYLYIVNIYVVYIVYHYIIYSQQYK